LDPALPPITADRGQIHQVLLNLCVNARDAMPSGGKITFETSLVPGSEVSEYFTGAELEKYVCVRICDTGTGMTRQEKAHIFEPFYTTKERGKGTGLGLSVVYGVINSHRGFVHVDSEPNKGTTFSIYRPLEHRPECLSGNGVQDLGQKTSAKTILLVEDEEMLRELGVTILEGEGYNVLAAKDGVEAVEMFEANSEDIGLVVCDLGLPRLGGRDAFMRMKEQKPGVRAIVASGYLEPNLRSEMLKAGVLDTIQKPYDFREMLQKIRSVIGDGEPDDHPRLF
jgi:CheY-like chemotaxis protein